LSTFHFTTQQNARESRHRLKGRDPLLEWAQAFELNRDPELIALSDAELDQRTREMPRQHLVGLPGYTWRDLRDERVYRLVQAWVDHDHDNY